MTMESSRVPQLKTFLYCMSLLTGCKVIGYLKAIIQLLTAISLFIVYAVHIAPLHTNLPDPRITLVGPIIVFVCGLSFIEAYFAIILLHGVHKRKPAYVKIWVVIQFSILIQNIASLIILTIISIIFKAVHDSIRFEYTHLVIILTTIIADIYCTLIVYSYYRDEYYRDRSGNIINADIIDSLMY